jgi:uncharacterized protein (TIGR02172 family)
MQLIDVRKDEKILTIYLKGHIDSANAGLVEEEVTSARSAADPAEVILDCSELEYISSAGLRVILRLKKAVPNTRLIQVSPEVYEIFDMTGFTEMMSIQKAYRMISVEGCEKIGEGANGSVYRIDPDTIVKVYKSPDALPEIQRERELARTAFVLGIPPAIPYDVVNIKGSGFGSVFELLNATSLAKLLINGEITIDEAAGVSIDLLKLIHNTEVKPDSMPCMKTVALGWADFLEEYLSKDLYKKLHLLVQEVPERHTMLHGDYHIKNIMIQNGESLLIDMDTLCWGHPIFEMASMYNAYVGFSDLDHSQVEQFIGISFETAQKFWEISLQLYLGTDDKDVLRSVERKAMIIGYTRLMRREIRRNGLNTEKGKKIIENCRRHLEELVPVTETLDF